MLREHIHRSETNCSDPKEALAFLAKDLHSSEAKANILFVSNQYDVESVEKHIKDEFGGNVVACTTSGEIGSNGYTENFITGLSFCGERFEVSIVEIPDVNEVGQDGAKRIREEVLFHLEGHNSKIPNGRSFALLLIDGLSMKEEEITRILSYSIPASIPVVGGSAGDGLDFERTFLYYKGSFKQNTALVLLITTNIPFYVFKSQHFSETDKKMVITEADPVSRVVKEIDGVPAAEAYAAQLGVATSDFGHQLFSRHPVIINIGGENYVRSIQKVYGDNSLRFYCAIERGITFTLGRRNSIYEQNEKLFKKITENIGSIGGCIAFECILRRLEILDLDEEAQEKIMEQYVSHNVIGFHTYGEQFRGVHINQTMTGIAFSDEF